MNKHFDGVKAVSNISAIFMPGTITGIVGPNGSGKSTLINLLTGMIPFDSGAIKIGEKSVMQKISAVHASELGITRTFQDVRLFEQMSVIDNLLLASAKKGIVDSLKEHEDSISKEEAEKLLERVGISKKRNEQASSLSYGQRKLLEIARALAANADIYFFDEPFAGLFPEMRNTVSGILKELRTHGKTVILVEHDMDLIRALCDRLYVMDSGELLAEGLPNQVLARKDVLEAYLGE